MSARPARARLHAPRPRDQVRRLLPRPRRPVPRRAPARGSRRSASRLARRPDAASPPTRSSCPYNDVDGAAAAVERYGEGLAAIIVEPVAGNMGCVPPAPGLPRGAAAALRRERRAARLRRGDHRLPRRARRRAGALRRHARPDDPRQDRRRRAAARRVRRPRRGDGAPRAGRRRLPGGHALRATRSRPPPASRCCGGCATRRSTTSSSAARARLEAGLAPFGRVQRVGAMLTFFAGRDEPVDRFTRARHRALRRALPRPARARHLRRAEPVRVPVPVARARRRRDRRDDRGGGDVLGRLGRARRRGAAARARSGRLRSARRAPSWEPVFSPLAPERFALGLETVYEAYLVHYGRPRLFDPPDAGRARSCSATTSTRTASCGSPRRAASTRSRRWPSLISRCAALRAAGASGDGEAWVDAARALGGTPSDDEVAHALARHYVRVAA